MVAFGLSDLIESCFDFGNRAPWNSWETRRMATSSASIMSFSFKVIKDYVLGRGAIEGNIHFYRAI